MTGLATWPSHSCHGEGIGRTGRYGCGVRAAYFTGALSLNSGPAIRQATKALQDVLNQEGIALELVTGADVHMTA